MRVALLASADNVHTVRWANALSQAGLAVHLISQHGFSSALDPKVERHQLGNRGAAGYISNVPALRAILRSVRPDLLNAHYASGYGTMARLSGFRPCVLSVWGSDVFDFPKRSAVHRWWLKRNLRAVSRITSASHVMAREVESLVGLSPPTDVVPFGVDMQAFSMRREPRPPELPLTIGTVKTLAPQYGIDVLLRAFAQLCAQSDRNGASSTPLRLRIVGGGPDGGDLIDLARQLGVIDRVEFVGRVDHGLVPAELEQLDIYVALSRRESFGVAVVEACACGVPVVVSDVGGLPEVVQDGITGFVVPSEDPEAAALVLKRLVEDEDLRNRVGRAARRHVEKMYDWNQSVQMMIDCYRKALQA